MHLKTLLFLSLFLYFGSALAQTSKVENGPSQNPLVDYLDDHDEMGRMLSGWKEKNPGQASWFFGSYAMVLLSNNDYSDNQPYPGLEAAVPELWSDFKYLTPRYLIELAGGALANGGLMSLSKGDSTAHLRVEERFIYQVAGFAYLRMLQATIGDSLFELIVKKTIQEVQEPREITEQLVANVGIHCGEEYAEQFHLALSSSRWADADLVGVKSRGDSLEVQIVNRSIWHFPIEVLVVNEEGDSTFYTYGISESSPLIIPEKNVDLIILDPNHVLAEYFRYNNQWPRLKDKFHIQPFGALPDWNGYRITVNPTMWSDWHDEKRYGLKFTSGFGVDLWPAYPSDFRHRLNFELNAHTSFDSIKNWGGRFSYNHPLNLQKRLFAKMILHSYNDWEGANIGITKYIGDQTFLIQGPRLRYHRVNLEIEYDSYQDSLIWEEHQNISIIKASYSGLSGTKQGDRFYLVVRTAAGDGPQGEFLIAKSSVDLTGVFWGWLIGGLQVVVGSQGTNTPTPYQFTQDYAWQDGLSAIPKFRGQTKMLDNTRDYLGVGVSGGYYLSGIQLKLFTSGLIVDIEEVGWEKIVPRYAAGFGFEHKSFFTAGIYFPVWQSHPIEGEDAWKWRHQWTLAWNL